MRVHLTPLAVLGFACSPVKSPDREPGPSQYCDTIVRLEFPDGSWTEYNGCHGVLIDATYEFDPDDPPDVRSFKLQLNGADEPGFECWLVVTSRGICGPGFYDVGPTVSTMVEMATYDCGYVPDEYEGRYNSDDGQIRVDAVNAGSEVGDFTNKPLFTEFQGSLEASTPEDIDVIVTFDVGVYLTGEDSEQTDCLPAD